MNKRDEIRERNHERRNAMTRRQALKRGDSLFNSQEELDQLQRLRSWSAKTKDGSRADLNLKVFPQVWDEVRSDNSNCGPLPRTATCR